MNRESTACQPTPSDDRYLLPSSSSRGLTSTEHTDLGKPADTSANSNFVSPSPLLPKVNWQAGSVISKIEDILEQVVDCIIYGNKELVLHFKSRTRPGNGVLDVGSGAIRISSMAETRTIRFPGRTAQEAWKFSR